jgi:hypothetical protein
MMNKHTNRHRVTMLHGLRRGTLALSMAMGVAAGAHAQSATGELYGQVSSGQTGSVLVQNADNGFSRTLPLDGDGKFRMSALPPGNYVVTLQDSAGGVVSTRKIRVSVGSGAQVDFNAATATLDAVTVRASATSRIDVSTAESSSVYTAAELERLPVGRDVISVAALTPGVSRGSGAFGSLPVVAGASAQENGYYVNGFDVTDLYKMSAYSMVPFDAVAEQQVKTGGYPADFGRSLGGVVNVVTKSGTNEFHYGISSYFEPDALRSSQQNTRSKSTDGWYAHPSNDSEDKAEADIWASGPIVKDKLFFFALLKGKYDNAKSYGTNSAPTKYTDTFSNDPEGIVKLDWNINDANSLGLTWWRDYSVDRYTYYKLADDFSTTRTTRTGDGWSASGGSVTILNWTSYLTDALTMKAMIGKSSYSRESYDSNTADCPYVRDYRDGSGSAMGCWTSTTKPGDGVWLGDKRSAARLDFDWQLGDHDVKFGLDYEKFTSTAATEYSGGARYYYYAVDAGDNLGSGITVPDGVTDVVRVRTYRNSGTFTTYNTAAYLSDDWQLTDKLHLSIGLRNEGFDNRNAAGETFIKSDNLWSPRLGFAYDLFGDSSFKLYGSLGRYYIPIPTNTNIRLAGNEYDVSQWYTYSAIDGTTAAPTLGTLLGTVVNSDGSVPATTQVTAANLKPMYQDELILGFEQAIWNDWVWGVKGTARKVGNGMDDYCYSGLVQAWGEAKYGSGFDASAFDNCVLINPGEDTDWYADIDGKLTKVTIPASVFGVDKYKRIYYGMNLTLSRPWDGKWSISGSYTWAHNYGNAEGYSMTTIGQDDAGISEAFDYPSLMSGSSGNLNNDRRHVFKAFGTYQLTDSIRLKGSASAMSGTPKLCLGYVPDGYADSSSAQGYGSVSFYCGGSLHPRGSMGRTPWTYNLDAGAEYQRDFKGGSLVIGLDVFNVFDFHRPTYYYYYHDETLSTSDPNYGTVTYYQDPRYVRLTARWSY